MLKCLLLSAVSISAQVVQLEQPLGASDRALGAILGSFVADAASMPLHWIYDTKKVAKLVGKTTILSMRC
jgi:hypothetical protein